MKTSLALASLLVAAACAHGRPEGSPPETAITIQDADGTVLSGQVFVLGLDVKGSERCTLSGTSCAVAQPAGVYLLKFAKERGGRVGHLGGAAGAAKGSGCLLSRVRLEPGKAIVCKANGGFDPCRRTRVHTMNCGEAVQQTWQPAAGEPLDIQPGDIADD